MMEESPAKRIPVWASGAFLGDIAVKMTTRNLELAREAARMVLAKL
jgi:hypothetical protein